MGSILREYQHFGFQWLKTMAYYQFGGILADDMGLGKTIQALAFVSSEMKQSTSSTHPTFVVAPASLIYNWEKECTRFTPHLRATVVSGTKEEREKKIKNSKGSDLLITSYPLLRRDIDLYKSFSFQTLILDEAQSFKNQKSQTFRSIKQIRAKTRFALSGTPIENSLDELWSIFNVILPGLLPRKRVFEKMHTDEIVRRVSPFILRRMKKDVLTELPDKIESTMFSELTEHQKKVYLATLEKLRSDTKMSIQSEGFEKSRMKILAGITRLRQICCHPSLYIENYEEDSGKYNQFLELLEGLLKNRRRVLIFSQFTRMLQIMQKDMNQRGLPYHYISGKTKAK
jgi:SNF2 family DNA or RNA helicase